MQRYQIVETTFGYAAVAFDARPFRLLAVHLPRTDLNSLCQAMDEQYGRIDNADADARAIGASLVRYFDGGRIEIPWSVMDLSGFTPSQQAVYRAVTTIPYGQTLSYGQVAKMANRPRAARFVGNTMANNRYPVLIPCHRVIKSDGSIGGFGGRACDTDLKRRMLALEAA
ncbi:methylated-DNA--[protein]-cysteine S-methyltransferase [Desulfosarcina ovata]|uniref:methylated-DNA--[protein]-cysteine S-methyltransferase n=2 Tax=Desulfosarcina ovata TaxID=83564 RepID=A0A5K8ABN2_9BACT|nr:methylated-DNA--[protein]-cysteine S-methyltransferase [Desulfosarcina ovata]BBO82155.1 hypothetical protein DSCO28_27210 [Desulfosarcina ovata subsp. sediminis]BBO89360.1 hypothetical protein DSCOOX_25400 [Desulfosarcina ovata subsp. ovata]